MLGVTHFNEDLLKAIEGELAVGTFLAYLEAKLNSDLSHSTGPPS